ncbi:hypothetical protein ES708_11525 [subsurface metagenome]
MKIQTIQDPNNFEKKGNLYLPKHHSVADWDFEAGTAYQLFSEFFHSEPSCLRVYQLNGSEERPSILCRVPETLVLPQGEVRTFWWTDNLTRDAWLLFRNQHALGGADHDNTYLWSLTGNWATLSRWEAGVSTLIGSFVISITYNGWFHWRTAFWNGTSPDHNPALCVNLYKEVAAEWIQQGETLYDEVNKWADSEINRVGIGCWVSSDTNKYFDDTEIWAPVAE